MPETERHPPPDRAFFLLLTPLTAASLPSLVFCALEVALWLHGAPGRHPIPRLSPESVSGGFFALEAWALHWISRWNSLATLAATGFLVATLLRPRWRSWCGLALIPYGVLLCADFTLRWRTAIP